MVSLVKSEFLGYYADSRTKLLSSVCEGVCCKWRGHDKFILNGPQPVEFQTRTWKAVFGGHPRSHLREPRVNRCTATRHSYDEET